MTNTVSNTPPNIDHIEQGYLEAAVRADPPMDASAAEKFWFRLGAEYMARLLHKSNTMIPSPLEKDPEQFLLVAFERTRRMWLEKTRIEHFLLLAVEDQTHTLSRALLKHGTYLLFREELASFLNAAEKTNVGGVHEVSATPEALRVFVRMAEGKALHEAVLEEEPHVWARLILEKHLPAEII